MSSLHHAHTEQIRRRSVFGAGILIRGGETCVQRVCNARECIGTCACARAAAAAAAGLLIERRPSGRRRLLRRRCRAGWKESLFLRPVATSQPTSRPAQPRQSPRAVDGPGPGHGRRWMLSHAHTRTHTSARGSETSSDETARNSIGPSRSSLPANIRERARAHHKPHDAHARHPTYTLRARDRSPERARARTGPVRVSRRFAFPVRTFPHRFRGGRRRR